MKNSPAKATQIVKMGRLPDVIFMSDHCIVLPGFLRDANNVYADPHKNPSIIFKVHRRDYECRLNLVRVCFSISLAFVTQYHRRGSSQVCLKIPKNVKTQTEQVPTIDFFSIIYDLRILKISDGYVK